MERKPKNIDSISGKATIRRVRYENIEIHVSEGITPEELVLEIKQAESLNSKTAVFVYIPETLLKHYLDTMLQLKYKFHRHDEEYQLNKTDTPYGVYAYYKWNNPSIEDKVPAFASSIEGASAFILSPDEKSVIMVLERRVWKFPSESVNRGETGLEAAMRGAREELSIKIDKTFKPIYLGGYNHKSARPGNINDNYGCYAIKAESLDWKKEDFEIDDAKWIPITEVVSLFNHPEKKTKMGVTFIEEKTYPESHLVWARNYAEKRGLSIQKLGDWNYFF